MEYGYRETSYLPRERPSSWIGQQSPSDVGKIDLSYVPGLNDSHSTITGHGLVTPVNLGSTSSLRGSQCVLYRSDGSTIVNTPERQHHEAPVKPVTEKEMKWTFILSIVSIFLFPPTGLAALYFARKAKVDFQKGIEVMDLTVPRRYVKYTQRLIIASVICGIVMYALIFAGLGRAAYGRYKEDDDVKQS